MLGIERPAHQLPAAVNQPPEITLPARFYHSRQLALGCKYSKTDPADAELSDISPGSAANRASIIGSHFKLGFLHRFISKRFFSQIIPLDK
jgi:hypothetical protein